MPMKFTALFSLILFALSPCFVWANSEFREASRAYKNGHTKQALKLFLSIEKKNSKIAPQLTLNIALLYLKSNQFEKASNYLSQLTHIPEWSMLASYYLGIVAHQKGSYELAGHYLKKVAEKSNHNGLKEKAKRALERMRAVSTAPKQSGVTYYASFTSGYEDNALALPSDQLGTELQAEDNFSEIFVQGDWEISDTFELNAYVSSRSYSEYTDLNTNIVNLGGNYQLLKIGGDSIGAFDVSEVWADGSSIYRQWQGQITSFFNGKTGDLETSVRVQQIFASTEFSFLNGFQYQIGVSKDWSHHGHGINVNYHYQINNRDDLKTTNEFTSYSPRRHRITFSDDIRLIHNTVLNVGLSASRSEWRGTDQILDREDNVKNIKRQANQYQLNLGILYEITSELDLSLSYEYLDNNENISTNRYTNSQFMVMLAYEH